MKKAKTKPTGKRRDNRLAHCKDRSRTLMQAIQLLDDLTGKVPLIRVDHIRVEQALRILKELIQKEEASQAKK